MGYAPNKVKRRRHSNHLRLYAALTLLGVRFSAWALPGGTIIEIVWPDGSCANPCFQTLPAAMRWAATTLGIE